jgi:hypothetical protein
MGFFSSRQVVTLGKMMVPLLCRRKRQCAQDATCLPFSLFRFSYSAPLKYNGRFLLFLWLRPLPLQVICPTPKIIQDYLYASVPYQVDSHGYAPFLKGASVKAEKRRAWHYLGHLVFCHLHFKTGWFPS